MFAQLPVFKKNINKYLLLSYRKSAVRPPNEVMVKNVASKK